MTETAADPIASDQPDARDFREEVAHLIAAVQASVDAERAYWLARLRYSRAQAKWIALLAVTCLSCFVGAVLALIFGLLLTLASIIGPGLATLTVAIGFTIVAASCAYAALLRARNLRFGGVDDA